MIAHLYIARPHNVSNIDPNTNQYCGYHKNNTIDEITRDMWRRLIQAVQRTSTVHPQSQSEERASKGPDEEEQVVVDELEEEEPKKKKNLVLVLALLVFVGIIAGVCAVRPWEETVTATDKHTLAAPWPHEYSDIQPDPRVTYGSLKNGIRYMVMQNAEPPNQLALRMHVNVGSYQEEEDQLGLAHFLEHMAFNGLRNVADKLAPKMQRLGIGFGAHMNAHTFFDRTTYEYDLPNSTSEEALDLVFQVMRDYADGMLLEEEEIEKERGVILAEMNVRDSIDWRLMKKLWSFLLPGHLLPKRWVIGDADVISTAPRQRFVDFYENYYTPERITFVSVGDADSKKVERRIIETYHDMTAKGEGDVDNGINFGGVPTGTGFEAAIFSDKELVDEEIFIVFARPYKRPKDSVSERSSQFPLRLAHGIITRRLQIAAKKEGSPFRSGWAGFSGREGILGRSGIQIGEIGLTLASNGTNYKDSIPILEGELRKAMLFGFAAHELAEVKANYRRLYQRRVEVAPTRKSEDLADLIMNTINDDYVFSSPNEDLRIFSDAVESITLDDIHEAFKRFWDTSDLKLVLFAQEDEPSIINILKQAFEESKEAEVEPPETEVDLTFHYTTFGESGQVISDVTQTDLGIRQLQLSNNIRVNLKTTDFQAETIRIAVRFGTGRLSQPYKPGIQWLADDMMERGGLGRHSVDDLERILAGKTVDVSFSVREGFFRLNGKTKPEDLTLQMQLMAAYFIDPGFREEALRYWRQQSPSEDTWFKSQLDGAQYFVNEFLRGNDMRFAVPSLDEMTSLTIADVKDWFEDQLAHGYMEISIVGAFDMHSTIDIILNTFGALPEREASPPEVDDDLRYLQFPTPGARRFEYKSKLPTASSIVVWKVPHTEKDIRQTRRFGVLASVLGERMRKRIREDIGESYSPRASTDISEDFFYGVIRAESKGTSDASERIGNEIIEIARNLTKISADDVMRATNPIVTEIEQHALRDNSYWLNTVMLESQAKPWKLDWARGLKEDYASITVSDLQELAVTYLKPTDAVRIVIHPVFESKLS